MTENLDPKQIKAIPLTADSSILFNCWVVTGV
jgi:hypothetical protein